MELIKQNTHSQIIKSLLVIFVSSIILAISAKIKIPFYPVPMTMQTFVVMLLGLAFGYKIGLATVSLYLLEGIAGLPVFSGFLAFLFPFLFVVFLGASTSGAYVSNNMSFNLIIFFSYTL